MKSLITPFWAIDLILLLPSLVVFDLSRQFGGVVFFSTLYSIATYLIVVATYECLAIRLSWRQITFGQVIVSIIVLALPVPWALILNESDYCEIESLTSQSMKRFGGLQMHKLEELKNTANT